MLRPSFARLKLWRDTLEALGHRAEDLTRDSRRFEKFHLSVAGGHMPLPVGRVYALENAPPRAPVALVPLSGGAALEALLGNLYRQRLAGMLGYNTSSFRALARTAQSARIATLSRPKLFERLNETLDLIRKDG